MTVTVDLDHRPPLTFYLSVGLVAGGVIALQIGIMRVFSVGSWAHFGSLVVSLAMLGFGLTSAVMCVGKGWFERHWRGAVKGALLLFGPLMVACEPRRPAGAVQRHLPGLRPDAEVAAVRQLPALLPAVPGRRALSRHRLPEGAEDLRPRLFRRSRRLGPLRPAVPAGDVCLHARRPDHGAAAAVAGRRRCCGSWRSATAAACCRSSIVARALGRRALRRCRRCSASPSSPCRTTRASPTPASSPTTSASTSAPRRSATWRSIPAPTCISRRACPTTPRSICRNAGQRLSRPVHRRRRPVGHHQGPAGRRDRLFPLPADVLSLCAEAGARDLRRAVRRRHLDRGGAEAGSSTSRSPKAIPRC